MDRRNKRAFVFRFMSSYTLILMIPLLIWTQVYTRTVHVVEEDAVQLHLAVLEQSKDMLDRTLLEMQNLVSMLSMDQDILSLLHTSEYPWSPQLIYQYSELRRELSQRTVNQLFADIHIYFRGSHTVVSSEAVRKLDQDRFSIGGRDYEEWADEIVNGRLQEQFYYLQEEDAAAAGVAYVKQMPYSTASNASGFIVVLIREEAVLSMLQRVTSSNGSYAYISTADGQVAFASPNSPAAIKPSQPPQGLDEGFVYEEIDGEPMLVSFVKSKQTGWVYTSTVPSAAVLSKASHIRSVTWMFFLLSLAIGFILAFYLSLRSSRPIMRLQTILSNQLPVVRAAFFDQWQQGNYSDELKVIRHAKQAQLEWPEKCSAAAAVVRMRSRSMLSIPAADPSDEQGSGASSIESAAADALTKAMPPGWYVHRLPDGHLAVLAVMESDNADRWPLLLEQYLLPALSLLQEHYPIRLSIGAGPCYEQLHSIWRSSQEAMLALDASCNKECSGLSISYYGKNQSKPASYYYPIEFELDLINRVRKGDLTGLKERLQQLEIQNFELRRLTVMTEQQLLQEVQATIRKLAEQLHYTDLLESVFQPITDLRGRSGSREKLSLQQVKLPLLAICEAVIRDKEQQAQSAVKQMTRFIEEHHADSSFGLAALARQFNQSESAMSAIVKDQLGVTFTEHLEKLRLDEACRLLSRTSMSINEIALQVGYNSDKAFRRAFKRSLGLLPTAYRQEASQHTTT